MPPEQPHNSAFVGLLGARSRPSSHRSRIDFWRRQGIRWRQRRSLASQIGLHHAAKHMFVPNFLRQLKLVRSAVPRTPITDGSRLEQSPLAFPPGPPHGARLTPDFVREIGRFAYLFAWPMVNVFNRYTAFKPVVRPRLIGGIVPIAPINHLCMLHDYIDPRQRYITCPRQDLVYGFGILDLRPRARGRAGARFRQALLGVSGDRSQDRRLRRSWRHVRHQARLLSAWPALIGTARPDWHRRHVPRRTNIGTIIPRVFQEEDRGRQRALQPCSEQIMAYPLSEFDGSMKTTDWSRRWQHPLGQARRRRMAMGEASALLRPAAGGARRNPAAAG